MFYCFIVPTWNKVFLLLLLLFLLLQDTTIGTVVTTTELKSNFNITTNTPHLTLMGELWGVICEDLGKNWPHQDGAALYVHIDGLVQGRRNSNADALEPHPSRTSPSVYTCMQTAHIHMCVYMHQHIYQTQCKNNSSLHSLGPRKS